MNRMEEKKMEAHQEDYILAHKFSSFNREQIERSSRCGCFYCLKIFPKEEIWDWTDFQETALCPCCDIDSVIADTSGYEITEELLRKMNEYWF